MSTSAALNGGAGGADQCPLIERHSFYLGRITASLFAVGPTQAQTCRLRRDIVFETALVVNLLGRRDGPETVLASSSWCGAAIIGSDMANIRTAMNRGAFDFLTKPIDFLDFETTIAKTIRHVEVLREARRRQAEAERAHATLSRYFSPNLAERLASDADAIDLGGQRREIATLFTDIASFTALVETLEPDALGPLLNDYLTGMTDLVFSYDGTVAKIVGDALHMLFGAPGELADQATRAINCALALDAYAQSFRECWQQKGITLGVTRIGAHVGPAIVGNFGGGRFFDYTAYGDTVTAPLEAANKQLGTRICVTATLAARVEQFRGRPVGDLILGGKTEVLRAFEPLRAEQYADPTTKSYLEAFAQLEVGDPGAMTAFAAHVGKHAGDQLASFHLKRLLNGASGTQIVMD